jgi:predicted ATP-grasp superfamily ATP-dependent carboligase
MRSALVVTSGVQGLAVTRALGECGVPVVVLHDKPDDQAPLSRHACEAVLIPRPEHDGPAFVQVLLELAERHAGAVLIPTTDESARDIARHEDELGRHFRLACPSWDAVSRTVDKAQTYELAAQLGIPAPVTHVPLTRAELEPLVDRLRYPCLVKPRESHLYVARFGAKVAQVDTPDQLREEWGKAVSAGLRVMVQELIAGPDRLGVNYNAFRAQGRVRAECTARKVALSPPRFGMPRVVVSADVPEVVEPSRALLDALGLEGFANIEYKFDERDGTYKLFEVNCRHNLSSLLSVRCGLNFPLMAYRYADTGELPAPARARTGVYWIDEARDLAQSATRAGRDHRSLRDVARPWVASEKVFAVYDRRDPGPFLAAMRRRGDAVKRLVTRRPPGPAPATAPAPAAPRRERPRTPTG